MASISADKIIDDIELQLNQGTISDDSELSREQIRYWIEVEANFLIRQECDAAIKAGKQINPIYIARSEGMPAMYDIFFSVLSITAVDPEVAAENPYMYAMDTGKFYRVEGAGENFFPMLMTDREVQAIKSRQTLSIGGMGILDLYNDAGIVRIMTEDHEMVNKASTETIEMMQHLRFAGPKKNMPVYYRRGEAIYIEGFNDSERYEKRFILDYVPWQAATGAMNIGDIILPSVIDRVLQRGKLQMYGSTPDMYNDGEDNKQSVYHTAIQNPAKDQAQ